jgi:hypothetical protein
MAHLMPIGLAIAVEQKGVLEIDPLSSSSKHPWFHSHDDSRHKTVHLLEPHS